MTGLLASLGKQIANRWVATIVLPGLFYLCVTYWAIRSGAGHPFAVGAVSETLARWWSDHHTQPAVLAVTAVLILAGAALAAGTASLLADEVVQRFWTMNGRGSRHHRYRDRLSAHWTDQKWTPPTRYLPQRAFTVGEQFRLFGERVHVEYGLSAVAVWPRIWLLTNTDTRTIIQAAHTRFRTDATLVAWGLLYLPIAGWWPPALCITTATTVLGWRRATRDATTLATLLEAAIDIQASALAGILGVPLREGRVTPEEGNIINNLLIKRAYTGPPLPRRRKHSATGPVGITPT
jgi:hypothetical protein